MIDCNTTPITPTTTPAAKKTRKRRLTTKQIYKMILTRIDAENEKENNVGIGASLRHPHAGCPLKHSSIRNIKNFLEGKNEDVNQLLSQSNFRRVCAYYNIQLLEVKFLVIC